MYNNAPGGRPGGGGGLSLNETKHARRLFVGNVPLGLRESDMMVFFEGILMSTLPPGFVRPGEQLVRACSIGIDKQFGFIEFSTMELTAAALGLDGIAFTSLGPVHI
jgi:splicing factor U2AF subunit